MIQRLSKGAHRSHAENNTSTARHHELYGSLSEQPKAPAVGKVDHRSIEMFWEKRPDAAKGDKRSSTTGLPGYDDEELKYALEEEKKTHGYSTVYVGYSDFYKVQGLDPLHSYNYRLKIISKEGDVLVSPTITVCTTDEPYNSEHLHRATSMGDLEALKKIIAAGDVNLNVNDKLGNTPLMNASQKGHLSIVDALLAANADVHAANSSGKNSLMLACHAGHDKVARRLREMGADWICADKSGNTAIHWAIDGNNLNLIKWMLEDGIPIDIEDRTSGWTPLLRCAAITGNANTAGLLLQAGANVDAVDRDGKTPLMIAALNGHLPLVEKLIECGANTEVKSQHGKTAMEMAESFNRRLIVTFFEKLKNKDIEQ